MSGRRISILVGLLALNACAAPYPDTTLVAAEAQQCTAPRPEVCTRDYRPVCATLQEGMRKTYSNGCAACSDSNAVSWIDGECPE